MDWISVEDRLPEEGTRVLIYRKDGEMTVDYRINICDSYWIWCGLTDEEMQRITHWMPLPEPPVILTRTDNGLD